MPGMLCTRQKVEQRLLYPLTVVAADLLLPAPHPRNPLHCMAPAARSAAPVLVAAVVAVQVLGEVEHPRLHPPSVHPRCKRNTKHSASVDFCMPVPFIHSDMQLHSVEPLRGHKHGGQSAVRNGCSHAGYGDGMLVEEPDTWQLSVSSWHDMTCLC